MPFMPAGDNGAGRGVTRTIPIIQTGVSGGSTRSSPVTVVNSGANGNTLGRQSNRDWAYANVDGRKSPVASGADVGERVNLSAPSNYNHVREASPAYRSDRAPKLMERKTSVEALGERVVGMLDDIERRVEHLREQAHSMESEKEALLEMIATLKLNQDILRLGQGEREDMEATMHRLQARCRTVQVLVDTPRDEQQQRALSSVNDCIDKLVHTVRNDLNDAKHTLQRWLNACDPDLERGDIDQKFQSLVIECTADDQKRVRRRLKQLQTQIDRADMCLQPED